MIKPFMFAGYEPETVQWLALNPTTPADAAAINANIRAIKYGSGISLASVTANLSLAASYYFVTNSSVDLRPYALIPGVQFSIAATGTPATTAVFGGTVTAGVTETLGADLCLDPNFNNPANWTLDAGFTVSGGKLTKSSATGAGYAAQVFTGIAGRLLKAAYTIESGSGIVGIFSGVPQTIANGAYKTATRTGTSELLGMLSYIDNTASVVDSFNLFPVNSPNSTGFTASSLVDGGINATAASFVVTISRP